MSIDIDFKKKFIVNGQAYNSIDEMPHELRQAFQKTLSEGGGNVKIETETSINFNGREYKSVEAMPADIRQMYEKIMKAAAGGNVSAADIPGLLKTGGNSVNFSLNAGKPIGPEATFTLSLTTALIVLGLIGLIAVLYFAFAA